ncbi:Mrp/NBP35 family ATP-binding protein [Desulfobotulus sp. H1]|uniref:Iron-sulfur cluster carrier protein n=1 Tax=Desulfobotulus pelophilus TaxID=2823377 RepID=A0ABT3N824_9BACT|nr:Mrp/NBP35 family ATP-binding protein [Desulfobotulus pelophilus]MCW7753606.1 Mrp/NBP35 family ATP-binding protein [Desulfobotulus pelophilus]
MIHEKMPDQKKKKPVDEKEAMMKESLGKIRHKLLVMSGKGGVGKSSLATNLAVALAEKGFKTGLMDVDLHGPSIAQMMGLSGLLDVSEEKRLIPADGGNNLGVISMQSLMQDKDQAVIWRGPAKSGMIQQFITSVEWGTLDFLIIDAPPGTGDEPLTVVQSVPDAKAIVVTTPQEVALADVRKSINFCKTVHLEIAGLVENMGPFDCPHCNQRIALFKTGGGQATALATGIAFLGTLPYDAKVVDACDAGEPIARTDSGFTRDLETVIKNLMDRL